ncbi:MAG TPA: hypothetical protein VFK05_12505 [Polyangiaceae bacterium]|nr:hypothetical protein [Polyangiaceae bacterium]
MSAIAWHEMIRMEATVRAKMQSLDVDDDRILRLIDLLPLPAGLLLLGQQLGETETDLMDQRRAAYASSVKKGAECETEATFSPAGLREIQKLTGRSSGPEILLALVDWKMVVDRITKTQSMGRA